MSTVIITCQTIKNEVNLAIRETGVNYPMLLVDSGLHNFPDRLRRTIQEQIDKIDNVSTIIMAFGYCGNGLLGIRSQNARLIVPRADDCITLLLGSHEIRNRIQNESGTYFLTKGWLDSERNIITEYRECVARYGQDRALRIMKTMFMHYRRLMVIDTKAYELKDVLETTRAFAETIGLTHEQHSGSLRFISKLLTGPWNAEEFIILEPGNELTFDIIKNDSIGVETNQAKPLRTLI